MDQTMHRCIRGVASLCPVAVVLIVLMAAFPASGREARPPARVTTSDASRLVFRVQLEDWQLVPSGGLEGTVRLQIPGFVPGGAPGEPAAPTRQFLVVLPPSGGYRVSYRVLASVPVGTQRLEPVPFQKGIRDDQLGPIPVLDYRLDPEVYQGWAPPPMVEADDPVWVRRQRALPVHVNPLDYNPSTSEAILATEIEITVTFSPDAGEPGRPSREGDMWDGIYARMFVNPAQAKQWRAPQRYDRYSMVPGMNAAAQGPLARISVRRTGMHGVTAATLSSAGFPVGRDIADLHLFQRTYDDVTLTPGTDDLAFHVEEDPSGTSGVFDASDLLVFYGRRLREDPDQLDGIEKFADHNVYWLGTGSGPQMAERTLTRGFVTADTATASFPVNDHFEEDTFFFEGIRPDGGPDFYMFNTSIEATLPPNVAGGPTGVDLPLELWTVRPGTTVRVRARLFGATYRPGARLLWTGLNNSRGETAIVAAYSIPGKSRLTLDENVPAASFDAGHNAFRIRRIDQTRPTVDVHTNWVILEYEALYRARNNRLDFNTASLAGDTSLTVTGISDQNLWLFDITDPDRPVRCIVDGSLFTDVGGSFALSFRDNIPSQKRYSLLPPGAVTVVDPADVEMDTPSAIIGDPAEAGVDVLVVAHASYVGQMQGWATYRRAQGYRVLLVDVEDVYDEFNNGVPHAQAIDRFTRRFFELGGAGVLVLVGDSSEDNKIVHDTSGPNFVPSHSWADNVPSLRLDEVVTTDKQFVKLPGPGGTVDAFPDMIVGRMSVGSPNELTIVLAKIQMYERVLAGDLWRRRILVFADDRYSVGASEFGGFTFCPWSAERGFESGQEASAQTMEAGIGGYEVLRFYLGDYTEAFYNGECKFVTQAIDFARGNVTPAWLDQLSQGASIVTMQAHMNRSLVTHESVFSTLSPSLLGGTGQDHQNIDNRGRPFIMFGMGCHFSDYALHKERGPVRVQNNKPNGDAFAEQLLFANNRGAAAVFGSSGFEYLNQTNAFMNTVAGVWFYQAPYESMIDETEGQWVLGQLMFLVEAQLALSQTRPIERYHILGDPLLRIDAGPPAFDVTVNGTPFQHDGLVASGGGSDTLLVEAVVSDENAILDFGLEVAGVDASNTVTITPLSDQQAKNSRSRQYRLSFTHVVQPETYDIVMRAFQAPDTAAGQYHMRAEFRLRVVTDVSLSVNGRPVQSGEKVPAKGDYRVDLTFPVFVPESEIGVTMDGDDVGGLNFAHPTPQDTTAWIVTFSAELSDGEHTLVVSAGATDFTYVLRVSSEVGLRNVIPFPNPFTDSTHFVFTNDVIISDGRIDVYTTSGKRIRRIEIPPEARQPGQNAVFWDGRDGAGDEIANGTYLFIVKVRQLDHDSTVRGKLSRMK